MSVIVKIDYEGTLRDLKKIAKELLPNVEKGLEKVLDPSLEDLKNRLKSLMNNQVEQTNLKTQDNNTQTITIPKTDAELLTELTKADFSKINTIKDYNDMVESKIALVIDKDYRLKQGMDLTTSRMSSGVNYRLNMSSYDTFESQYARASQYFNEAVFAFEIEGELHYFLNPGIDLTQHIKIVCSNQTGDNDRSRKRFDRLKTGNSRANNGGEWADWTLTAAGVEFVKNNFIKLNDVLNQIKNNDFSTASNLLVKNQQQGPQVQHALQRVDELSQGKTVQPNTKAYYNLLHAINNLKIKKKKSKQVTTYTLVTNITNSLFELKGKEEDFLIIIRPYVHMWQVSHESKFIKAVEEAVNQTLDKYR